MAKSLFLSLLKHYLFWLLLFAFGRTVFLAWNYEELSGIPFAEIIRSYAAGFFVDTAMACYFLAVSFIFFLLAAVTERKIFITINNILHVIFLLAFFLITLAELPIYDEWHTKLSYKAIWFLSNPAEVIHTASTTQLVLGLSATAVCTFLASWLYMKKVTLRDTEPQRDWSLGLYGILAPALIFTGIRGGFATIPIQLSDAYYSQHNILNLISLNSTFNLASSCLENSDAGEPYHFMDDLTAENTFDILHSRGDSSTSILTTNRPNIVLVVLEGWSADVVGSFGGIKGITPNFDSLAEHGMRFTNCFASGMLSDQGMAAVFSAFPAQPKTSIITQPNKYVKLPCINKELKKAGYHTSFMFGGQLSYGNIKSYMYFNEFDKIIEGKDFTVDAPEGKLGYHDEFLFDRQIQELKTEQEPFFAAMFTLSTHGPFDFPLRKDLNIGDKEEDYVNSIYYADSCIGDFIRRAKNEPWYKNTLFVFISDHSHNSPSNFDYYSPEYRRIPFLLYGEVLDSLATGGEYAATSSQTDLGATLLGQLKLPYDQFRYSKNLFDNQVQPFAFYTYDEGFGFVESCASLRWGPDGRANYEFRKGEDGFAHCTCGPEDSLTLLKKGQAILQQLSVDYWSY